MTQDERPLEDIWAIILAAGESKRMGLPKMLLKFDGITMIEKVMNNVKMSDIPNAIVVLGSGGEEIKALVEKSSFRHCYNENFKEGMLSSVKCGFRNLPGNFAAALVFQGDQPFISPPVIHSLINAYLSSGKGIVIPVYSNKRGHPLLVDCKYRNNIELLDPQKGLRELAQYFSDDVLEVPSDEPGILRDFDTYDDYTEEINKKRKDE
jgi:molybdenum cofactor cytidylyltransferase